MKPLTHGIVSYAGLDKDALLSGAGKLFNLDGAPPRYRDVTPLFPLELVQNMDYAGKASAENKFAAPSGFSISPAEYHFKMMQDFPALYTGDNRSRNFDYEDNYQGTGVFTVDAAWANLFPQYRPFLGDRLVLHLIGGGCQAVAVPESLKVRSGFLDRMEEILEITPRAQSFVRFAVATIRSGEPYDANAYAGEYLRATDRHVVDFTQRELELLLQRREMSGENPRRRESSLLSAQSAGSREHSSIRTDALCLRFVYRAERNARVRAARAAVCFQTGTLYRTCGYPTGHCGNISTRPGRRCTCARCVKAIRSRLWLIRKPGADSTPTAFASLRCAIGKCASWLPTR